MNLMESPKQRDRMAKPVLRVIGEIERHDADEQR